jgi:hypothetical protein
MFTDLDAQYPNLARSGYRRKSYPTTRYNCVAWALGDETRWWEPDSYNLFFWPSGIPRSYAIRNYVEICRKYGYERCPDGDLETGYEKLAIFTQGNEFKHVARQRQNGMWTSKLGQLDDIDHHIDGFDGSHYGTPTIFMKRKIPD